MHLSTISFYVSKSSRYAAFCLYKGISPSAAPVASALLPPQTNSGPGAVVPSDHQVFGAGAAVLCICELQACCVLFMTAQERMVVMRAASRCLICNMYISPCCSCHMAQTSPHQVHASATSTLSTDQGPPHSLGWGLSRISPVPPALLA